MKVYINGWRGPWGWINHYISWINSLPSSPFEITDDINDANLIFQADLTNWRNTLHSPDGNKVICNVLDFGEWLHQGHFNKEPRIMIEELTSKKNAKVLAISKKVIDQIKEIFGFEPDLFYYPSQVILDHVHKQKTKKKIFVSFCRMMDPGKAISEACEGFRLSGLGYKGWKYMLFGPERPRLQKFPKGVMFGGYLPTDVLHHAISHAAYVVMPSYGEGLGLPIIEGLLLGTPFISRDIAPPNQIFSDIWNNYLSFKDNSDISIAFHNASKMFNGEEYYNIISNGFEISKPWLRENAFMKLTEMIYTELNS